MTRLQLTVPEMSCDHCRAAIEGSVAAVPGVLRVDVDLEAKRVVVEGDCVPSAVTEAIVDAGYEVAGEV